MIARATVVDLAQAQNHQPITAKLLQYMSIFLPPRKLQWHCMKRLLAAALSIVAAVCAALCGAATTLYARADDSTEAVYARANSRESYFCSSADLSTGLFAVPYTYCVEVLGEEGDWYSVKYADDYGIYRAVYGYVRKSDFTLLDETPEVIYLYRLIDVTFSQQSSGGTLPTIDDITISAAFYGNYYSGAAGYSYVLCQNSFGYISGAIEDYALIESTDAETAAEEDTAQTGGGNVVAYISLVVIASLAIGLVVLACTRGKGGQRKGAFGKSRK